MPRPRLRILPVPRTDDCPRKFAKRPVSGKVCCVWRPAWRRQATSRPTSRGGCRNSDRLGVFGRCGRSVEPLGPATAGVTHQVGTVVVPVGQYPAFAAMAIHIVLVPCGAVSVAMYQSRVIVR